MRLLTAIIFSGLLLLNGPTGSGAQEKPAKPKPAAGQQPATKTETSPAKPSKDADKTDAAPGRTVTEDKRASDVAAIRKSAETYVAAFNAGNAKDAAEHYTDEAEYIDENGVVYQGRAAIEALLKSFFDAFPDRKVSINIASIRFIGPSVATEDGTIVVTRSKDAEPVVNRYTVYHIKHGGKWLVASVRDFAVPNPRQHREKLKQLDWLLGDWVHEGKDAVVEFSGKTVDNGNFILRSFKIRIAGQEAMSGSERIGWDGQVGKLRSWIFDSDGGHSDGYWHRDGDSWVLKSEGVTADGQSASSTSIYKILDDHSVTFQSVDHEVAGSEFPDGVKLKIVRRPPQPE